MPAYSETAGSIILPEAFALGKMMQSASWRGRLRDGIIPSDVDLYFDNHGSVIFCDFSRTYERWDAESTLVGQRLGYQALIMHGPHCAVLCKHNVTPEMNRVIDTLFDVASFHVMIWEAGRPIYSPVYHGSRWEKFVMLWVNSSDGPKIIRRIIKQESNDELR